MQINGRNVTKGTELKISGERGRFRFVQFVKTDKEIEWIDVWGGPKGAETMRSFKLDRVKRVHYKNQTVGNLSLEYKAKRAAIKAEKESETTSD
jgi:Na+-transporting NADH:ubiquinone oxidoreductase subunit NqrF